MIPIINISPYHMSPISTDVHHLFRIPLLREPHRLALDSDLLYFTFIFTYLLYRYLKEFRVEQCPQFLQHKCTQHKPFTCFHWHFMNQRRRRPIRDPKTKTFNYSPDMYCTKYDETTGICPDGDEYVWHFRRHNNSRYDMTSILLECFFLIYMQNN